MSGRRTLLVGGGSRGIGTAVARLSAAAGYDVILTYLPHNQVAAEAVAGEVRRRGDPAGQRRPMSADH